MGKRVHRSPQRCENCGDPLGDSEALVVTGLDSHRVHFVHRPSTPERAMCFRWGVNGAEKQRISLLVQPAYDPEPYNIQLAIECRLDETACAAVGLDFDRVRAARRTRKGA